MASAQTGKHRSTRIKAERGIYKRQSTKSHTGWLYSVAFGGKFVSKEADGITPLYEVAAARARRGELIGATRRGEKPVLATKTTFGELAEQWLEGKRLRPRTAAYYRDALDLVLLPRFGKQKIAAIDADAIVKLIRDLEHEGLHAVDPKRPDRPLGHSSIDNYCKPLQGVLALALRRNLIAVNPFSLLVKEERPQRAGKPPAYEWSGAEIDELLAASLRLARQPESRADYTPLLRLTVRLGLRLGEVLGLRWQDFDRAEGVLHVRQQWLRSGEYGPPKTLAGVRSIPLPHDLQSELAALRLASSFSGESDPIFASRAGTPLMHRNVTRRGFEAARDEAGLSKGLTFHDLRHAAASRLIHEGHSPVVVAKILGHSDPAMTLRVYSHVYEKSETDEAIRRALAGAGS